MDCLCGIVHILFAAIMKWIKMTEVMDFMQQDNLNAPDKIYYPTQDEVKLLQDILDFINLIMDVDAQWYCTATFEDLYIRLRLGYQIEARWEKDGETFYTFAWVKIRDDMIDVYLGKSQEEVAIKQVFKNHHPFEYGEYGVSSNN